MHPTRASRTAEFMALFRAIESARRPRAARLFDDPLACRFVGPALHIAVHASRVPGIGAIVPWFIDRRWPGARSSGVARTRFIDDALSAALRDGVDQVVMLGAGFDSRAYRIPGIEHTRVFEVDHPATMAAKRARLRQTLGQLPAHVTFVGIDFNEQALADALPQAGFDSARGTFFIWEGVTNYLSASAIDATLRYVAGTAPSSRVVFTYIHRGVLDGSVEFAGTSHLITTLARAGEPWTFGFDPDELPAYLEQRGLLLLDDLGAAEYRARHMGTTSRNQRGYEFYRVAVAEVAGQCTAGTSP